MGPSSRNGGDIGRGKGAPGRGKGKGKGDGASKAAGKGSSAAATPKIQWTCTCGIDNYATREKCRSKKCNGERPPWKAQSCGAGSSDAGSADSALPQRNLEQGQNAEDAAAKHQSYLDTAIASGFQEGIAFYTSKVQPSPGEAEVPSCKPDWIPQCNLGKKISNQKTKILRTQEALEETMGQVTLLQAKMREQQEQLAAQKKKKEELEKELVMQKARPHGRAPTDSLESHIANALEAIKGEEGFGDEASLLTGLLAKSRQRKAAEAEQRKAKEEAEADDKQRAGSTPRSTSPTGSSRSGGPVNKEAVAKAISVMVQQACVAAAVVLPEGFSDSLGGSIAACDLALGSEGGDAKSAPRDGEGERGRTRKADDDIEALRNDQDREGKEGAKMAS